MSTVLGVLGFAALFGAFGLMAPVLRRKRCGGDAGGEGNGVGCGGCSGGACRFKE